MKAVILAGGLGTRLSEETTLKPKPMVEVGGRPILWHIMKIYSHYGINEFIVCLGYKGYVIKEYFSNYFLHNSDVTFDFSGGSEFRIHNANVDPWKVTLIDTGDLSMTGGRLRRVRDYLEGETFCFTYGDGVADVNVSELVEFHRDQGRKATLTAVQPPGRFGALAFNGEQVTAFQEKPEGDGAWINGGFFVLEPEVIDLIEGDQTTWEEAPLRTLAESGELSAYKHTGFWQPMDTLRDRTKLEEMWANGEAHWKVWNG